MVFITHIDTLSTNQFQSELFAHYAENSIG